MAKQTFPQQVFVAHDPNNDTPHDQFLADDQAENLIEGDGPSMIATYTLLGTRSLKKVVQEVKKVVQEVK